MEIEPEILWIGNGPAMQILRGGEVLGEFAVDVGAVDVHGDFVRRGSWVPNWLGVKGGLHFGLVGDVCCRCNSKTRGKMSNNGTNA